MGHAHDRTIEAVIGGRPEDGIENCDGRLGSLDSEPLLTHILGGEELLEGLRGIQPPQDVTLLVGVDAVGDPFNLLLDPSLLLGVGDVHVLDADRPAVGVTQHVQQVAQLHPSGPADAA